MSLIKILRGILGIVATAIAPSWNKHVADTFAQAEAALTPVLGDDAKRLCEDAAATDVPGIQKLGNVVADLMKIAADKGIKADALVLTVVAQKAFAQIKADAPAILEAAIETGVHAAVAKAA